MNCLSSQTNPSAMRLCRRTQKLGFLFFLCVAFFPTSSFAQGFSVDCGETSEGIIYGIHTSFFNEKSATPSNSVALYKLSASATTVSYFPNEGVLVNIRNASGSNNTLAVTSLAYSKADNMFYFGDNTNHRIFKISPATGAITPAIDYPKGTDNPMKMGCDKDGALYFIDEDDNLYKVTFSDKKITKLGKMPNSDIYGSGDLALDGDGNLWYVTSKPIDSNENTTLYISEFRGVTTMKASASTTLSPDFQTSYDTGIKDLSLNSVAFSGDGNLYLGGLNNIYFYNITGNYFLRLNNPVNSLTASTDFASCAYPSEVMIKKNVVVPPPTVVVKEVIREVPVQKIEEAKPTPPVAVVVKEEPKYVPPPAPKTIMAKGRVTVQNVNGLYMHLINREGKVIGVTPVNDDGSFGFAGVPANEAVTLMLTSNRGKEGDNAPAMSLPYGFVSTTSMTQTIVTNTEEISNLNFGLDRLPISNNLNATPQNNPVSGEISRVTLPELTGSDPDEGKLGSGNTLKIKTLPSNATLYYNGEMVKEGQVISNYVPAQLSLDPEDGIAMASFTYSFIDNANKEGASAGTVSVPFVSPLVLVSECNGIYLDNNNNGRKDANEDGKSLPRLFVKLINSLGKTQQVTYVDASTGSYAFVDCYPGNYNVIIDDNEEPDDTTPSLPQGWRTAIMTKPLVASCGVQLPSFGVAKTGNQ